MTSPRQPKRRLTRLMLLLAGIVIGQCILYGPSLIGRKVLLPLDILGLRNIYLPQVSAAPPVWPQDTVVSDLVYMVEPARRFVAAELQAGHFPMWQDYQYAGAPTVWPKFSPFLLLETCFRSPVAIAWGQMLMAVVAGLGAYLFFRRVVGVGFWPAVIPAWCYPMTGFFIFWQGFPMCAVLPWLPWALLAVDATLRQGRAAPTAALSLITALVLVSGNLDIAGQVLLISGFFALWCLWNPDKSFRLETRRRVVYLIVGWFLGFLLAAPYVLPTVEYTRTSNRLAERGQGMEERPPIGLSALPQVVVPDFYGNNHRGCSGIYPKGEDNLPESAAAGYVGLLATLLVAPLAWCSRRHRVLNIFWSVLAFIGLSWCLDVPGFVDFFRLPALNLMSHNRLVFATALSLLALAATGLEALAQGEVRWRHGFWVPVALLLGLGIWSAFNTGKVPARIGAALEPLITRGESAGFIRSLADLREVQASFVHIFIKAAALCGVGLFGWLLIAFRKQRPAWLVPLFGVCMVGEVLSFAYGRNPQCDWSLYYPRLPALEQAAKSDPGRVIGCACLPASLTQSHGLHDIRGYDMVDPGRLVQLLMSTANPRARTPIYHYAVTEWLLPRIQLQSEGQVRLPPVLSMLAVRYVIFPGSPPAGTNAAFQSPGYWVMVNASALPRAYVPRKVQTATDAIDCEAQVEAPDFDPSATAYVEELVDLPGDCRGSATIIAEIPNRVTLAVDMQTPGMVVLADLWDKGWHAYLDGKPVEILRANYAVRGVLVPAGKYTLEFCYLPGSLVLGLWLALGAAVTLAGWVGLGFRSK